MLISARSPWIGNQAKTPGLQDLAELGKGQPGMTLDTEMDWQLDGCFVGAEGRTFPASTPWQQVPPVVPNNGKPAWRTVIMVNGIMTDVALQAADMQRLANTGCNVVGIHNDTNGMMMDLAQCLGDKLDLERANNAATMTAQKVVEDCLTQANPPLLVGHSQGALVVSNALGRVLRERVAQGEKPEATARLFGALEVATLGGASWTFPSGPKYNHFVNIWDVVPMGAGVGAVSWMTGSQEDKVHRFSELNKPQNLPDPADGVSNYLARVVDRSVHGPQDVYIPELERQQGA